MSYLSVSAVAPKAKHPSESILFGVDFSKLLATGETISAVSSVSASPSGLTIGSGSANAAAFDNDDGKSVPIGKGAQFRVSYGADGTDYTITVVVTTTNSNTRVAVCTLQVTSE